MSRKMDNALITGIKIPHTSALGDLSISSWLSLVFIFTDSLFEN